MTPGEIPASKSAPYQDHICLALVRDGRKAAIEAPVDGTIEANNPKVWQRPHLIHDDPYGEGWLAVKPSLDGGGAIGLALLVTSGGPAFYRQDPGIYSWSGLTLYWQWIRGKKISEGYRHLQQLAGSS